MRPVLILVTSRNKKDALTNAKAFSDLSNLELKSICLNEGLEHSHARHFIAARPEYHIECYELNNSNASRTKLLDILTNLKREFLKANSENPSFADVAFAAAILYPTREGSTFLDVIACSHTSGEHLSFENNNKLRTAIYEVISQQSTQLNYPKLAKTLALLLSK